MANLFGMFGSNAKDDEKGNKDKKIVVNEHRCPQNHPCPSIKVCPVGALSQKGYDAPKVDMDKCIKCGKCVKFCPIRAISLE